MPTFIALLRGINVGKAKRIAMAELRPLLEDLGYTDVKTLLNSGNVVFSAGGRASNRQHAAAIGAAIAQRFGFEVPVIVKCAAELAAIVAENPLHCEPDLQPRLLVAFAADANALAGLAAIESRVEAPERFVLGQHAAYLFCASGILQSKAGAALLGKVGHAVSTRNWATVLKLQALADAKT